MPRMIPPMNGMAVAAKTKVAAKSSPPSNKGGDRKSQDFHMNKASVHIQKALERRMAMKDK